MTLPLIAAVVMLSATALNPSEPALKMKEIVFGFFVKAENPPNITPNLAKVYQERHLNGFKELYKQGKLLAVGPLEDAGDRLGIIILDVPTVEEAKALTANDPWVKCGEMKIEFHPWYCEPVFQKVENLMDLTPLWLGVLTSHPDRKKLPEAEAERIQAGHIANIQKMAKSGDLFLAGPFGDNTKLRGLFFFFDKDKKAIEALVAPDPTIKEKRLQMTLLRWWAPKGMFKPYTGE